VSIIVPPTQSAYSARRAALFTVYLSSPAALAAPRLIVCISIAIRPLGRRHTLLPSTPAPFQNWMPFESNQRKKMQPYASAWTRVCVGGERVCFRAIPIYANGGTVESVEDSS